MSQMLNVLLIDDDPDTQRIFRMVFDHHQQHQLMVSPDSQQALEVLQTAEPDIIVIDLMLPDLDGYQLFDRIMQNGLAPQSCIIATTAYHTSDTHASVIERGFEGFLPKPLQSYELIQQLEQFAGEG